MIKMLQYKMYPAGELRCPTTALVFHEIVFFYFMLIVSLICLNEMKNTVNSLSAEFAYRVDKKIYFAVWHSNYQRLWNKTYIFLLRLLA